MRPIPSRVLLASLCIGALSAGLWTSQFIFFVVAFGSGVLLGTTLSTSHRPVTYALQAFRNHAVAVRLWGAPPPDISDATLVLASVNALGAGVHVHFNVRGGGAMHLKIAQPKDPRLAAHSVVLGSARYVQWNGKRLSRVSGAPAVTITLSELPASGGPESVA
jgi:hypothetical protein